MKKILKKVGWICLALLLALISIVAQGILGILLSVICSIMAQLQLGSSADVLAVTELTLELAGRYIGIMIFCYHILAIIGFGLWYYFGCGKPKVTNPAKTFRGKSLPATVILALGLCLFAQTFVLIGSYIAPDAIASYAALMESAGLGVDTFSILASILLAPIGEEILCRGLTYHYAKKAFADNKNRQLAFWAANIVQSLAFAIMHGNLIQGLYAFFLGLGLGWLRERYNSLYPAMLAHAVINFTSTFLMGYLLAPLPENLVTAVILMVISIAIIALGAFLGKEPKKAQV